MESSAHIAAEDLSARYARHRGIPNIACATVCALALLVLAGWWLDARILKSVLTNTVAMNPMTAILFILSSVALWRIVRVENHRADTTLTRVAAGLVAFIGLARLFGYFFNVDVGIDHALFSRAVELAPAGPNRMAPNTALAFTMAGLGLLLLTGRTAHTHGAGQILALTAGALALFALIGYAYAARNFYGIGSFIPMAVHTALGFFLLAIGMLYAKPQVGLMGIVTSRRAGGAMARQLLPVIIFVPTVLGWLCLQGEAIGIFSKEFSISLFVVSSIMACAGVTWSSARSLNIADTRRDRAEEEAGEARNVAETASRAKSGFLATMSHELRTPLNGVIGMTELLLGTALDAQQRRFAWLAKSSGDALLALINDILDFSKIEAGKLELESIDFDPRYTLESVGAAFASRAESKGLELIVAAHADVPDNVRGDPNRLQQILINLVSNAIKFTETGEVVVRAAVEDEGPERVWVRFTVSDTGIGIPDDRLEGMFESFSQADASTTRRFGGTGLGLSICKQLVELMGGRIGVQSKEGVGSTYCFSVPFERPTANPEDAKSPQTIDKTMRVLIVDDNATNREILHEQLTNWGLAHAAAASGNEAMELLRAAASAGTPYDLALLDMQMPVMSGRNLAEAIKSDPVLAPTVLILLSSMQGETDASRLAQAGIAASLAKPIRQSQLLETIRSVTCAADREIAPSSAPESNVPSECPAGVQAAHILLAEDHPISQEVAATMLRGAGYQCTPVDTGRQALDEILKGPFDLVLMDCQMPEMDGFTATRAIREAEQEGRLLHLAGRRLPIIALTANAVKGDRERCLDAGMDDYLTKPLQPKRLMDLIESHLHAAEMVLGDHGGAGSADADHGTLDVPVRDDAPPFDLGMLVRQWGGDREFVLRLIRKFQAHAPGEVEKLTSAIAERDSVRAAQLAHGLKGSAAYLYATAVRRLASQLETTARACDFDQAAQLVARLVHEVERCANFEPAPVGAGVSP